VTRLPSAALLPEPRPLRQRLLHASSGASSATTRTGWCAGTRRRRRMWMGLWRRCARAGRRS